MRSQNEFLRNFSVLLRTAHSFLLCRKLRSFSISRDAKSWVFQTFPQLLHLVQNPGVVQFVLSRCKSQIMIARYSTYKTLVEDVRANGLSKRISHLHFLLSSLSQLKKEDLQSSAWQPHSRPHSQDLDIRIITKLVGIRENKNTRR